MTTTADRYYQAYRRRFSRPKRPYRGVGKSRHTHQKVRSYGRSIALMDFAQKAKREGKKVGAASQDQELATEVVGF